MQYGTGVHYVCVCTTDYSSVYVKMHQHMHLKKGTELNTVMLCFLCQ